ncbi:MAG TPA: aromatic ring-hydroxylating dioxygenase subunit alpha [Novosphingobium sp.]|nr:aromatic ring-hydroxylating dioxygenase subunit alpha [Novosphingobium sp.]
MATKDAPPPATAEAQAMPGFPPHVVIEKPPYAPGIARVPVDRFFKQEYHDLEVERIWKKAWQWACREEEIPDVGDYQIYEVAHLSFIVIRTAPDEIKAYWNSCPHRARKLVTFDGRRASELRCMFHGWAWNLDGSLKEMSCGWDFPGARPEEVKLPEVKVGTWGGFVFINPDPDAESLEAFLGELPEHFEGAGFGLKGRWKQVHVVADIAANWKVAQEAFLEPWHLVQTHPQLLRPPAAAGPSPGNSWDDFGNWMRSSFAWPPGKTPQGYMPAAETPQQYINQHWDYHLNEDPPMKAGPDDDAGKMIRDSMREFQRQAIGEAADAYHEYHMNPGEMLSLWPNFHPWQAFSRLMYRFRPNKSDPNRCLMDVLLLTPWPDDTPRPAPAKPHFIAAGHSIIEAKELGQLARIFAQDLANMPEVQLGLKSSKSGYVILSDHNEAPLRRWHDQYEKWMGLDESVAAPTKAPVPENGK